VLDLLVREILVLDVQKCLMHLLDFVLTLLLKVVMLKLMVEEKLLLSILKLRMVVS
jgi:hypothetical protein